MHCIDGFPLIHREKMMPINLEKLNRWQRAWVVASIAWIVLASSLYFSALDSGYSYTVPKWIVLWHNLNPLSAFIPLFKVIPKQTGPELNWSEDEEMPKVRNSSTVFSL
jgi:hypothetical protein